MLQDKLEEVKTTLNELIKEQIKDKTDFKAVMTMLMAVLVENFGPNLILALAPKAGRTPFAVSYVGGNIADVTNMLSNMVSPALYEFVKMQEKELTARLGSMQRAEDSLAGMFPLLYQLLMVTSMLGEVQDKLLMTYYTKALHGQGLGVDETADRLIRIFGAESEIESSDPEDATTVLHEGPTTKQ